MKRRVLFFGCVMLLVSLVAAGGASAQEQGAANGEATEERSIYYPAGFTMADGVFVAERSETELVRITFEGTVVYTEKLTYNSDDGWAELEGHVRMERDGRIVTADRAFLEIDDERYVFEGDVYIEDTQGTTPRKIWADHVEYDGETGNLTATGNVRLEEETRWFTAARMVYDAENEIAVLEGDVFVSDERATVTAQHMEIDLKEERFSGTGPGRIVLPRRAEDSGE